MQIIGPTLRVCESVWSQVNVHTVGTENFLWELLVLRARNHFESDVLTDDNDLIPWGSLRQLQMYAIKVVCYWSFKKDYSERKENAQHRGPKCVEEVCACKIQLWGLPGGPGLRTHLPIQGMGPPPWGNRKSHGLGQLSQCAINYWAHKLWSPRAPLEKIPYITTKDPESCN